MYAYFEGCDPLKSKAIERSDQMLPYFMMKVVGSYPGLPGLFVAGIFSGALSSVSSFVNSLAAVTLEDFLKPNFASLRDPIKGENKETMIAKLLAFFFGLLCLALTYLAEQMTGILQASLTVFGVVGGPLLGLFALGMCTRSCSAKSALISFLASLILGFWIGFGSLSSGLQPIPLETSIQKCTTNLTTQLFAPSSNYSTSISLPSSFSPSNSNGINKKRSKRESMMENRITATNNDKRNYNDDDGYTSSSYNSNSNGNSSHRSNLNNVNSYQLQPVNLVHHHFLRIRNDQEEGNLKSRMTKPASFSSSTSPSSSSLFALESRWRFNSTHYQTTEPSLHEKKEGENSKDHSNTVPGGGGGGGNIQSSHDYYYSLSNSNESPLFDHEHLDNMLSKELVVNMEKFGKEKNSGGVEKHEVVITDKHSIELFQRVIQPVVGMSHGTTKGEKRFYKEVSGKGRIEERPRKIRSTSSNQIGLYSSGSNTFDLKVGNFNHKFKVTNDDSLSSHVDAKFDYSLRFDHGQSQFDMGSANPQSDYLTDNRNSTQEQVDPSSVFYLYRLSYMYLAGFTCIFEILLGLILSYTLFPQKQEVRPELLTPLLNRGLFKHKSGGYFTEIQPAGNQSIETRF